MTDAEALCTCGPYRRHRPQITRGAVTLACFRHDSCEIFELAAPTELGATGADSNETAGSVGATDPRCHCGHLESQHRARVVLGRYIDTCLVCDCTDFGAVDEWTVEDLGLTTLLYAWDAALCRLCEWRTSAPDLLARPDSRCLQCGAALTPVRLEMHSREPL